MRTILIAEDDLALNQTLSSFFRRKGYFVDAFVEGQQAMDATLKKHYDILLLDVMLPTVSGLSILERVRKQGNAPVILVTAKGAEEERILGFRHGADDYVSKPFNLTELALRVAALIRRSQHQPVQVTRNILTINDLTLNYSEYTAKVDSHNLELTSIQFQLLWALALNAGEVISKADLSEIALDRQQTQYDRSIDMHISRIRKKLASASFKAKRIMTVHRKGFCLR